MATQLADEEAARLERLAHRKRRSEAINLEEINECLESPRLGAAPLAAQPLQDTRLPSAAMPPGSEEVFLMIETCAGASVSPKGFDKRAIKDHTVPQVSLRTATNAPTKMTGGKRFTRCGAAKASWSSTARPASRTRS